MLVTKKKIETEYYIEYNGKNYIRQQSYDLIDNKIQNEEIEWFVFNENEDTKHHTYWLFVDELHGRGDLAMELENEYQEVT